MKSWLDAKGISYPSNATKADLMKLVNPDDNASSESDSTSVSTVASQSNSSSASEVAANSETAE
ncbi:HeH/LEM domain-containing protein [Paucilactobacillus sp. N302-9]